MGELLNLNLTETEEVLSQLVISGTVRAKTDRPTGVVHFSHSLVSTLKFKFSGLCNTQSLLKYLLKFFSSLSIV